MSIYTDGTLNPKDKLGMVNVCLNAIGEVPLEEGTVLEELQAGTDGAIARDIVSKTMIEVQNEGYFFNTDYGMTLVPDSQGFIALPASVLRIDSGNYTRTNKYVIQDNKVKDLKEDTIVFENNIKADVINIVDYPVLPFNAWNYIAHRAARLFQKATVNSPDLDSSAKENETLYQELLKREHNKYMDYNLLGRVSNRHKNPYWFDK